MKRREDVNCNNGSSWSRAAASTVQRRVAMAGGDGSVTGRASVKQI